VVSAPASALMVMSVQNISLDVLVICIILRDTSEWKEREGSSKETQWH